MRRHRLAHLRLLLSAAALAALLSSCGWLDAGATSSAATWDGATWDAATWQ